MNIDQSFTPSPIIDTQQMIGRATRKKKSIQIYEINGIDTCELTTTALSSDDTADSKLTEMLKCND